MNKLIYSKDHKFLAERLKIARESAGFNQKEVAKLMGKTQSYVSKVESGQRKVDVIQLKEFSKIYEKDLNFFVK